jgi:hypothetical protein
MKDAISQKIMAIVSKESVTENDQIAFFVWTRHILELNKQKKTYPILNFYCNWVVHPEINRYEMPREILTGLAKALYELDKHHSTHQASIEMSRCLGPSALRLEIETFYKEFDFEIMFLRVWGDFIKRLWFGVLLNKRIEIRDNYSVLEQLAKTITKPPSIYDIKAFCIQFDQNYKGPNDSAPTYLFALENSDKITFLMPISLIEIG